MTKRALAIAIAIITYVFVIVMSGAGWNPFHVNWNFTNSAQFGDSFGPLNTALTAIAAVSAYLAFLSQKEELEHVKSEAEEEKIARTARDFDQNFFNLMQLFRETVKEIEAEDRYNGNPLRGRDGIRQIISEHILNDDTKTSTTKKNTFILIRNFKMI